jgi:DNA repair protein SbcD/Mre11
MKILHTSDWHVGKVLKGRDRSDEHETVLRSIVGAARAADVDLVLIAGDLF